MNPRFLAAWFAVCAAIGWAGSAVATSCTFEAVGERAELELLEVTVNDEPADVTPYKLEEGRYVVETADSTGVSLKYVVGTDDRSTDFSQTFYPDGGEF